MQGLESYSAIFYHLAVSEVRSDAELGTFFSLLYFQYLAVVQH